MRFDLSTLKTNELSEVSTFETVFESLRFYRRCRPFHCRRVKTHQSVGRYTSSRFLSFNPVNPNSDENEISLYIINICSNFQVMRIKKVITQG